VSITVSRHVAERSGARAAVSCPREQPSLRNDGIAAVPRGSSVGLAVDLPDTEPTPCRPGGDSFEVTITARGGTDDVAAPTRHRDRPGTIAGDLVANNAGSTTIT